MVAVGVLLVAVSGAWAHAHGHGHSPDGLPLAVEGASVTQSGADVLWRVEMRTPFSPEALGAAGRSLCLLIERDHGDGVTGELCVVGPRAGTTEARLKYRRVIGTVAGQPELGRPSIIDARVTRTGARELTASFEPAAVDSGYAPIRWQVQSTLAGSECAAPTATGCAILWPAKAHVAPLHPPEPTGCTATGPAFVGGITTTRREIALTFDDGPWYQTPEFLTLLEREKSRRPSSRWASTSPNTVRAARSSGGCSPTGT